MHNTKPLSAKTTQFSCISAQMSVKVMPGCCRYMLECEVCWNLSTPVEGRPSCNCNSGSYLEILSVLEWVCIRKKELMLYFALRALKSMGRMKQGMATHKFLCMWLLECTIRILNPSDPVWTLAYCRIHSGEKRGHGKRGTQESWGGSRSTKVFLGHLNHSIWLRATIRSLFCTYWH